MLLQSISEFRTTLDNLKNKPHCEATSLPAKFYTDAAWCEIERSELFSQQWICVGRSEEVKNKGDYFALDLAGEPIILVHGLDGKIRALSNVCRHRGTTIAQGKGNRKSFLCPYHHWAYDTAGTLVNAPFMDHRQTIDLKNCRLPEIKCTQWMGFLFVNLHEFPEKLSNQLTGLEQRIKNYHLEQMHLHYLTDEVWQINWKCLVENFMEGYHLSPLHKTTLHTVNPSNLCKHLPPGDRYFGYEVGFTSRLPEQRLGHADLCEKEMDTCVMFAVPPGLTVGIGSDYSSFLCIRPKSATSVDVKMGLIFHGESWLQRDIDNAITLFQDTMAEDKEVLLRVQAGMQSKHHQPGPLANADMEGTIWDFYQYLGRVLGQKPSA